ncbi:type II toxin-antitoxin system YoeB family toxin [Enterococcus gallinarum]|uniref:type II toxin-antitoxin system YoeB family toxin n=1 Tax=Enterococcus gallinarum TaxID=1353 RepID=UPI00345C59D3
MKSFKTRIKKALKFNLNSWCSRRIDSPSRLVYRATDNKIEILACRYHYYNLRCLFI